MLANFDPQLVFLASLDTLGLYPDFGYSNNWLIDRVTFMHLSKVINLSWTLLDSDLNWNLSLTFRFSPDLSLTISFELNYWRIELNCIIRLNYRCLILLQDLCVPSPFTRPVSLSGWCVSCLKSLSWFLMLEAREIRQYWCHPLIGHLIIRPTMIGQ